MEHGCFAMFHGKTAITHNFYMERLFCVFERLGKTYYDHLTLIGKRVVDFLLVLIELFSLGVTAEVLRANIG